MPPTFADMKQENIGLQKNIDELKADKQTLTEKIMAISKLTLSQTYVLLYKAVLYWYIIKLLLLT